MARPEWRDSSKERYGRRMLQRWRRSGLTLRAFCAIHHLAEHNVHAWRRTLAERDRAAAVPSVAPTLDPPEPLFLPVHLQPEAVRVSAATPRVLVLRGGRRRVVRQGFDPATLRQLLVLLETDRGPAEERSC